MRHRGDISVEHTVWCARARNVGLPEDELPFEPGSTVGHPHGCESYLQVSGSAHRAATEARENGWTRTREFGWLCPPCRGAYVAWKRPKPT